MNKFNKIKTIESEENLAKYLSDNIFIIFNCSLTKRKFYEETLKMLHENDDTSDKADIINENKEDENAENQNKNDSDKT
ncbi:MAG: hypothetical protein IJ593_00095 [Lachnospiraceae bacterium]|nr:hypothetical protein [Lachnospiraceae bacterium]